MVVRSYDDECSYLERVSPNCWRIKKGFQPNMKVEGVFYVNEYLEKLMFDELRNACRPGMVGGFLPGTQGRRESAPCQWALLPKRHKFGSNLENFISEIGSV
jgi:hypothetical protein